MSTAPAVKAESAMVVAVRTTVGKAAEMDAVVLGQEAAQGILAIPRITDEEQAGAVADLLKSVKVAATAYKAKVDTVGVPLRQAQAALRDSTRPVLEALTNAEAVAKRLLGTWKEEVRQATEAAQRREAERALAASTDEAPASVTYIPDAPNIIPGSSAKVHGAKVLKVEMRDPHAVAEFDPSLVVLDQGRAKEAVRSRINGGEMTEPGIGKARAVEFNGILVWYEETIAVR